MITLVLGGARSGKSRWGEALAHSYGLPKLYLATAQAFDSEMADRIQKHRQQRLAQQWQTTEEPLHIASVLSDAAYQQHVIFVDCLTLWLSNLMHAEANIALATHTLQQALRARQAPTIMISNEVGLGLIAPTPLGRAFVDAAGVLHQAIAAQAQQVVFMVAGLPMMVKTP